MGTVQYNQCNTKPLTNKALKTHFITTVGCDLVEEILISLYMKSGRN